MYSKLKTLFTLIVLQNFTVCQKNLKSLTILNPFANEDPNEERRKYIGDLVGIKNIIRKTFHQEYLPKDRVNDSELAILKVSLLHILNVTKKYYIY